MSESSSADDRVGISWLNGFPFTSEEVSPPGVTATILVIAFELDMPDFQTKKRKNSQDITSIQHIRRNVRHETPSVTTLFFEVCLIFYRCEVNKRVHVQWCREVGLLPAEVMSRLASQFSISPTPHFPCHYFNYFIYFFISAIDRFLILDFRFHHTSHNPHNLLKF